MHDSVAASVLGALLLTACASTTPAPTTANANELAQSERIGRLEAELKAAPERAKTERALRIEAEVKAARLAYLAAIGDYNILVLETVCDRSRGLAIDAAAKAKVEAAGDRVTAFTADCNPKEPGDVCVERKAREAAER